MESYDNGSDELMMMTTMMVMLKMVVNMDNDVDDKNNIGDEADQR